MPTTVAETMTPSPTTIRADQSVREAAQLMEAQDIGNVVVVDDGRVVGIVTDRDIVVRVLAAGGGPDDEIRRACSTELVTASPDDPVDAVVTLMREKAVRRVPVMRGNELVGIVSLGDVAMEHDPDSALAEISAEPPNE
jgi:CBS domain-containing protein